MKKCIEKLPKRVWKVVVRADSAFFNGALLDLLESESVEHLIKVKMKGLKSLLESQKRKEVKNHENLESCIFEYRCALWKRPRRFAAVREINFLESDD